MLIDSRLLTLFATTSPEGVPPPHMPPQWAPSSLAFLAGIHQPRSDALKSIIAERGWPTDDLYSDHAEAASFMIALHADYDLDFQLHCHRLLLELATRRKMAPGYLAFLTDRILCNKGLRQRFGTQIREAANGCFVPKPMEMEDDIDALDALRREAGLEETLFDYYQRVNSGDLLLPRPLLGAYADVWEHRPEGNVLEFPTKK